MFRVNFFLLLLLQNISIVAETLPNILVLISDDQRFDQNKYMPRVMKQIANKGITYTKAYVSTPLCCPSRAALFTGQYNSRNKVLGNNYPLTTRTIFQDLSSDYFTGIIGKYLNSHDGTPLPEFNYWAVYPYGSVKYEKQTFNINGSIKNFRGHIDQRISEFAEDFFRQAKQQERPWFLTCAFFSPHSPAIADERDRGRFDHETIEHQESYGIKSNDKPQYIQASRFNKKKMDLFKVKQKESIYSMDRAIGKILKEIEDQNQISKTLIVFLSDNGIFHGEHNLTSKLAPYEEAIKVPLFIRYDPLISNPKKYSQLVAHLDVNATIYDLTNKSPLHDLDGFSLRQTFTNEAQIREYLLIEAWKNGWKKRESFWGIHTGQQILINNDHDLSEFYDLPSDPFQLKNRFLDPLQKERIEELQAELNKLVIDTRGDLDFNLPEADKVDVPK